MLGHKSISTYIFVNHLIQNVFIGNLLRSSSRSSDQINMPSNFLFICVRILPISIKMICMYRELLPNGSGFIVIPQSM